VSIRNVDPSLRSAAYVSGSFSFEAGASALAPFCANTMVPVSRSNATPAERAGATCGTRSARARERCSGDCWLGRAAVEPGAASATARQSAATRRRLKRDPFFAGERVQSRRWALRRRKIVRAAHAVPAACPNTCASGPRTCRAAMILEEIRTLLDAPPVGENAPSIDAVEHTLTAGYARALALEAERWRLERRIAEVASKLAEASETRHSELANLGRRLSTADGDLARLRELLASLRLRAAEIRSAAP